MRSVLPNYQHSIINFTSSIMKKLGFSSNYNTLREIDKLFQYDYQNIIVIVYGGLGSKMLEEVLPTDSFLLSHKVKDITSIFPAIPDFLHPRTSVESILQKEKKYQTDEFKNLYSNNMIQKINENSNYKAYGIFPSGFGAYQSRSEMYQRILSFSKGEGHKFIYAYANDFSSINCENSVQAIETIQKINGEIETLSKQLMNSLLFVVSDYGQLFLPMENFSIVDDKMSASLVEKIVPISTRCCFIKSKTEKKEEFKKWFSKKFFHKFRLFTIKEAKDKQLLDGNIVDQSFTSNYDFIAVGVGRMQFSYHEKNNLSYSGGITEEEMIVPLIVIERKNREDREIIRRVVKEDFSQFESILDCYYEVRRNKRGDIFRKAQAITKNEFFSYCARGSAKTAFVYVIDEEIVGFVELEIMYMDRNRFYHSYGILKIHHIYVKEEHRRQKIGTKLYYEAMNYAKKHHVKRVEFLLWDFEDMERKFVESLGMHSFQNSYEVEI